VGQPKHFSWRYASIGVGRMQMEIDATHITGEVSGRGLLVERRVVR
jgi:hypothetical protein